ATGESNYLQVAGATAQFLLDSLEDKDNGGFFDITPAETAIGELSTPKKDMGENADAALALIRLAALTGDAKYRQSASGALRAFAGSYRRYGYFAAQYARAVDALLSPGLHIVIVGKLAA